MASQLSVDRCHLEVGSNVTERCLGMGVSGGTSVRRLHLLILIYYINLEGYFDSRTIFEKPILA